MLFGYNQSNFNRELIMKKYMFLILLSLFFSIIFTACSTKIDDSINNSNQVDISNLLDQLAHKKEKEINDIIKELEQCGATKQKAK